MCNEFAQEKTWEQYVELMAREAAEIFSEPPPELPFGSIRPSEQAAILAASPGGGTRLDLIPWGWTPPGGGKGLVINIQSERRRDPPAMRGIAPMDRF